MSEDGRNCALPLLPARDEKGTALAGSSVRVWQRRATLTAAAKLAPSRTRRAGCRGNWTAGPFLQRHLRDVPCVAALIKARD